jgi:predicted O-methyltransferase YrrM
LKARLAAETLEVSANASTSVTFTEAEKVAVLAVLVEWLGPGNVETGGSSGLSALQAALAGDLDTA